MSIPGKPYLWLAGLSGATLLVVAIMVTADVLVRAATGRPFTGVFELTRLLLLVSFSLAIAPVQFFDKHLRVDIVSGGLRGAPRKLARHLDRVMTLAAFMMIVWVGTSEGTRAYQGGFLQPGIIQIPTAVPLGFLVSGAAAVCFTIIAVWIFGPHEDPPHEDIPYDPAD